MKKRIHFVPGTSVEWVDLTAIEDANGIWKITDTNDAGLTEHLDGYSVINMDRVMSGRFVELSKGPKSEIITFGYRVSHIETLKTAA